MKILKKCFNKSGGYVVLQPEDDQDLWHAYNLIVIGDCIKMSTFRKVTKQTTTGVKNSVKKKLRLCLSIKSVQYLAQNNRLNIAIKGRNIQQNEYLKLGQYHTFTLQEGVPFTLYKQGWDKYNSRMIYALQKASKDSEVAAMVMDQGIAHLCYIKTSITLLKLKVQKNMPKKRVGTVIYQKFLQKFYQECYAALMQLQFQNIKCIIIASPGFVKDQFYKFILQKSHRQQNRIPKKQIDKILLVKSSTGYIHSLTQVLSNQAVTNRLKDTKALRQVKMLQKFYTVLGQNYKKTAYGQKDVKQCINLKAVESLLISDSLFRSKNLKKRRQYNFMVEQVKNDGGQSFIFSSLHASGQKLNSISGIAAILRFPVNLNEQQQQQVIQQEEQVIQQEYKQQDSEFRQLILKELGQKEQQKQQEEQFL